MAGDGEKSVLRGAELDLNHNASSPKKDHKHPQSSFMTPLVWRNIIWYVGLHLGAVYGLYLAIFQAKWASIAFVFCWHSLGKLGVTAGAHRLWSHKGYKAKFPLRVFLAAAFSVAMENSILEWARDHRGHHKFSETDADPHNAKRGFFFSHMGWLMCRKHPDVRRKGETISLTDLERDPVVYWQNRLNWIAGPVCAIVLPTLIPWTFIGENFMVSYFTCALLTYTLTLHATWLVNSVAHMWGAKPYDRYINPVENFFVSTCALGEGWHNYHHTFPWDYKTAEVGRYATNVTSMFIDFMAWIGLAYDLKTVPDATIKMRSLRTGDGTHPTYVESKDY